MTAADGSPMPPAWLHDAALPIDTVGKGSVMPRVHRTKHGPLFFGPEPGKPPTNRFDAPGGEYRVLYAGMDLEASFAETLLRKPGLRLVDKDEIDTRRWSEIVATRDLRLARLLDNGLSAMEATALVSTGGYGLSRAWSLAIWSHPDRVDGILYRSKHDPSRTCVALFDRVGPSLAVGDVSLRFAVGWLVRTLKHYGKALNF